MNEYIEIRELVRRAAHGIDVALLWEPQTKRVFVAVTDEQTDERPRTRPKGRSRGG